MNKHSVSMTSRQLSLSINIHTLRKYIRVFLYFEAIKDGAQRGRIDKQQRFEKGDFIRKVKKSRGNLTTFI